MRVAVIGAGVTGLTCARALDAAGVEVVVLEKARGAGGRLSSRRTDHGGFDHGGAVLRRDEVRDVAGVELASFAPRLAGVEAALGWQPVGVVPVPTASALPKALAAGLTLRAATHVAPLPADGPLTLRGLDGSTIDTVDHVVVTAPAPQVAELLAHRAPGLAERAAAAEMTPCWTAMIALHEPAGLPFDAIRERGPVHWAVAESAKPGRDGGERWTVQATAAFSAEHLEDPPETVGAALLAALGQIALEEDVPANALALRQPALLQAHRWRYARVARALPEPLLHDAPAGVLAAGDWCTPHDAGITPGTVAAAQAAGAALAAALLP
ncbi:NAD(P)/FAD-dependent oxidoreductase [Paraconexibacter algicola]|uniref:NAD/FAD-dependent oxidoreductase n=1 Tax=Paraconexibacter algicola TaxID=2133960 RepID=A0A2T4ULJ1_9ACTN|nr:FAD-dependent oxidoreductase [Paraconexibacter algicola]PTL60122.1 NAD/FAD-dependent oxidoreductase [Paraconexibacter algicola]